MPLSLTNQILKEHREGSSAYATATARADQRMVAQARGRFRL